MRIPTSNPHDSLRTIVRTRSSTYTLVRPDGDAGGGRFGESTETTSTHEEECYLFSPEERIIDTEFGDRLDGDLQGLALPSADVEHDDRVNHGTDVYEVDGIQHLPSDQDAQIKIFSLSRVTNQRDGVGGVT